MVTIETWAALGYAKVGPRPLPSAIDQTVANEIGHLLSSTGEWELAAGGPDVWVRDKARIKGVATPCAVNVAAVIDRNNFAAPKTYGFLATFKSSRYAVALNSQDAAAVKARLAEFAGAPDSAEGTYALATAVGFADPDDLQSVVSSAVLPEFFRAHPEGRVLAITHNYRYATRQSAIRAAYTSSQYGSIAGLPIQNDTFATLRRWQVVDTASQLDVILNLGATAFFPTIQFFTSKRPGLTFVFIPGSRIVHQLAKFPTSWPNLMQSRWDFTREHRGTGKPIIRAAGLPGSYQGYRAYLQDPQLSVSMIEEWVRWLVERFNDLTFHQTDPAEFELGGYIDFITCFEHMLSVDSIFRRGLSCLFSEESAVRKDAVMEIADLLDELAIYRRAIAGKTDLFKELFHPVDGPRRLKNCLASLPAAISTKLCQATDDVYDHLHRVVMDSVFVKTRIDPTGNVIVQNRAGTGTSQKVPADFVADLIRSLRNTHHGYLTVNDPQGRRPSRFLALTDGTIPETLPYLGVLFAISLLADPKTLIGWSPLPTQVYD